MTSVGFAYEPASAGGSERQFTRDTGNAIVSFTWDEASHCLSHYLHAD